MKVGDFLEPGSKADYLVRMATVLGFIGMLRPHTFTELQPSSFSFVLINEQVLKPPAQKKNFLPPISQQIAPAKRYVGFLRYLQIKDNAGSSCILPQSTLFMQRLIGDVPVIYAPCSCSDGLDTP